MSKRILSGKIISDKTQKTVVVRVERMKEHAKYRKKYKTSKNYKAHVENSDCKIGDEVLIEECAPISKDKKWKVIKKIKSSLGEGSGRVARVLREAETPDLELASSLVQENSPEGALETEGF